MTEPGLRQGTRVKPRYLHDGVPRGRSCVIWFEDSRSAPGRGKGYHVKFEGDDMADRVFFYLHEDLDEIVGEVSGFDRTDDEWQADDPDATMRSHEPGWLDGIVAKITEQEPRRYGAYRTREMNSAIQGLGVVTGRYTASVPQYQNIPLPRKP